MSDRADSGSAISSSTAYCRRQAKHVAQLTAKLQPEPTIVRRIGPWATADYQTFKRTCNHGLMLEPEATTERWGGLMGFRPASQFANLAAAQEALRNNPVYRWLGKHVPRAVDIKGDKTPFVQFRRARIVVEHIAFAGGSTLEAAGVRRDRRRIPPLNAIERIEHCLNDGTLSLSNMTKEEVLENLLAEAKRAVQRRQWQSKSHAYPWIRRLAHQLCEEIGSVDPKLLLEVAAVVNPDCDERTVGRYVKEARQAHGRASDR